MLYKLYRDKKTGVQHMTQLEGISKIVVKGGIREFYVGTTLKL